MRAGLTASNSMDFLLKSKRPEIDINDINPLETSSMNMTSGGMSNHQGYYRVTAYFLHIVDSYEIHLDFQNLQ